MGKKISNILKWTLTAVLISISSQACLYGVLNDLTDEIPEASVLASGLNANPVQPAVAVFATGDSTLLTEGGADDFYVLVLSTRPESDVVITVTPDPQLLVNNSASPITFTFTPENYFVPRTITVTAVDDNSRESSHSARITHTCASEDSIYDNIDIPDINVAITDNDSAGVSITETGGNTNTGEAGLTDTYTVVLTSMPTATVTVTVTPDGQSTVNGGVIPVILTFDSVCPGATCWSTVQTITVGARNDSSVEGTHAGVVTHGSSSADPDYNGLGVNAVTASITDDDSAGVTIAESGGNTNITEGGASDTYTVVLTSEPAAPVTVTVTPDAQSTANGSTSPITLTFTSACPSATCWSTTQTVTVAARNDSIAEGGHAGTISHSTSSADANYNALGVASVTATITDNDSAGVAVTETGGNTNVTEAGGTDTYTVRLTSEPLNTVTVTVTPDAQTTANGSTTPINLTFTNACPGATCWSTTQTITVAARNDSIAEGTHNGTITHSSASADANYNGIGVSNVTASITDNETAGVSITEAGGTNVTEAGGMDTYSVRLTSEPLNTVTVTVTPDGQTTANGSTSPINLTFTNACPGATCWSTTQTVTVAARNDLIAEGGHNGTLTHAASSADAGYNGIGIASVTASITDNDSAGVSITESGGSTNLSEAGAADTYLVRLTSEPTGTVTVTITPDGQTRANGSTSPVNLTFTNACPSATCWNTFQTVTASARNDNIAEGTHNGTLTHSASSSDAFYNGIGIAGVTASITDNDSVGFIQPVTTGQTTDGAGTATFTFRLNSQPTGTVVIGLSSSNTGEGTVSPSSLTFNSGNWSSNQTITVTGVNDNTYNGNVDPYTVITATATGTDGSGYVGQNPLDYTMTNISRDFLTYRSTSVPNGNIGGIAGADAYCLADRPPVLAGKTVKAMIVDGVNRRACSSFNCNSGGLSEHIDWVLQPHATYFRIDGTTIVGSTNDKGVYTYLGVPQTVPSILSAWDGPGYYFTGIQYDWREWSGHTCNNWTDSSGGINGSCGHSGSLNYFAYGFITCGCNSPVQVICVEQP